MGATARVQTLLCSLLPLSLVHALTTCVRVDLAGCCRKWKSRGAERVPESDVALPCVFRIAVAARTFVHGSVRILFVSERRSLMLDPFAELKAVLMIAQVERPTLCMCDK